MAKTSFQYNEYKHIKWNPILKKYRPTHVPITNKIYTNMLSN